MQKKRQQKKLKSTLIVLGIAAAVIGVVGFIVFKGNVKPIGTSVAVERNDHIPDGDPVDSPSDPPTSGSHYANPMPAGFYTVDSPEYLAGDQDGYLIHSLEHGYVIFWYNCDLLDQQSCDTLLNNIKTVMDEFNGFKLIAFPRPSIDTPLIMTSWGQMQKFKSFDADLAAKFIKVNQPLAPEPEAS